MSPTIPPGVVDARVTEMYKEIKEQMKSSRDSWLEGTALSLAGWMRNRLGRASNQSAPSKVAAVASAAGTAGFHVVSELKIPVVSHLTSLCEIGLNHGIEHFQKQALKSAFGDVGPAADAAAQAEILKMQGEYVVLKLAQATVDAIRKVKKSSEKAEAARTKVKDCESFYTYLFACCYLDYRIARLEYYNSMLQTWAQKVGDEVEAVNAAWDLREDQFREKADELVGDYDWHVVHCSGQQYCLFKEEWLDGVGGGVAPAPKLSPPPGAGISGPAAKIQKPGLRGPDR